MEVSGWLASLAFLLAVPASIWLSLEGHYAGLYEYGFVPVVFGLITTVVFGLLLVVVLPMLNRRGW